MHADSIVRSLSQQTVTFAPNLANLNGIFSLFFSQVFFRMEKINNFWNLKITEILTKMQMNEI